jgi:hypothetical protein
MPHTMIQVSVEDTIRNVPCTCVDGRTPGVRYSVAGGSFGLIAETLGELESKGVQINEALVNQVFLAFAEKIGPVYLHTDQAALDRIFCRMGLDKETRLKELTPEQQETFIELASKPDYIGCGHVKLLLEDHQGYQIRPCVVETSLRVFFQQYFAGHAGFMLDVLLGRHEEETVVLAESENKVGGFTLVLATGPGQQQSFYCHRPMKKELMTKLIELLHDFDLDAEVEIDELFQRSNQKAERTLSLLAPELPVENVSL